MDTLAIIAGILGSGGFGALITSTFNRKKINADAQDVIGKVYGDLIDDCRAQLKHQAGQIQTMQDREVEYLKIIREQQQTERDLRSQIRQLENKLNKRLDKLEELNEKEI